MLAIKEKDISRVAKKHGPINLFLLHVSPRQFLTVDHRSILLPYSLLPYILYMSAPFLDNNHIYTNTQPWLLGRHMAQLLSEALAAYHHYRQ